MYSQFLFQQFASTHFKQGTKEVHFVFDHPNQPGFNPKGFEHRRRYDDDASKQQHHTHLVHLTSGDIIPRPWREYLDCKQCKRAIVEVIGAAYLKCGTRLLHGQQILVLAGCFTGKDDVKAWQLTAGSLPSSTTRLSSNAKESDMRVWRHATLVSGTKVLVYSPDTDVYNIGTITARPTQQYIVQINLLREPSRFVDIHRLVEAYRYDPDLATLQQEKLPSIMLQLYAITGCDYISFTAGLGKATFLSHFYQHANFITGISARSGCLSQTSADDLNHGFLTALRLYGTAYFKKHLAAAVS